MKSFKKLLLLPLIALSTLASCSNPGPDSGNSGPQWIDYVHNGSIKLEYDYVNRDFYKDGIGQVSLKTAIESS